MITQYQFACGLINRIEKKDNYKTLYLEHKVWHIKYNIGSGRVWESFDYEDYKKANNLFKTIKL